MAGEAYLVRRKPQLRIIPRAVHVVTTEAGHAAAIHHALHEIIALHAIFVRRAVGKVREGRLPEGVLFELPIILQVEADVETDRPVVILAFDWIRQRAALRMALDAGVAGMHIIHAGGVLNVRARGTRHVFAARPVAAFAAHVPFRDAMIADIEIDGVAAIAERARGSLHIVGRVERRPPIGIVRDEIRAPNAIGDVPLGGLGIIIIPDFGEIALLPDTAVDEPRRYYS